MSRLKVYLARAMDAFPDQEILSAEEEYKALLDPVDTLITNPFQYKSVDPIHEAFDIVERDYQRLKASDIVLADLSLSGYQYAGCMFEVVHAAQNGIPIVVVVGSSSFATRVFLHAYADFIAHDAREAVEYIRRVYTSAGLQEQMTEMKAYYDAVASTYTVKSVKPNEGNMHDTEIFTRERQEIRDILEKYARGKVCQLGIGTGDWTRTLCENAEEVLAIEQSDKMLAEARANLSSFMNVEFLQCDAVEDEIERRSFDCVVVYFLFNLLPPSVQDRLLAQIDKIIKPGGLLIIGDTKRVSSLKSIGLGRRRLQERTVNGKMYLLYKEHFVADTLVRFVRRKGFNCIDSATDTVWFTWAVARSRT